MSFQWSFGFDIRVANPLQMGRECQIHSTGLQTAHFYAAEAWGATGLLPRPALAGRGLG